MVANINNFGVVNFYESNTPKQEPSKKAEPICEDITPVEDLSSHSPESDSGPLSSAPDVRPEKSLFCRITQAAYDKGIAQQVDDELRSASVSAPKLVKALRTNDALGYTDTKNLQSTDLYNLLDKHYPLPFKSHAFSVARSK